MPSEPAKAAIDVAGEVRKPWFSCMNPLHYSRWLFTAFALLLAATTRLCAQSSTDAVTTDAELRDFVLLYQTDRNSVSRFYDLPWSEARFGRMETLIKDWQRRLDAVESMP